MKSDDLDLVDKYEIFEDGRYDYAHGIYDVGDHVSVLSHIVGDHDFNRSFKSIEEAIIYLNLQGYEVRKRKVPIYY